MRVALLGLGLIGGSVARALRVAGDDWWVGAWTPSGRGPRQAVAAGAIDAAYASARDLLGEADLIVLAAPPLACVGLIGRLAGPWRDALRPDATVTDVASTKAELERAAHDAALPWVGGHPMSGRETSGFEASDADLFRDRPWVITAAQGGGDPAKVEALALACGARPVSMDAGRHDRLVASVSHLPLLTSVMLVEAVTGLPGVEDRDWGAAKGLAAGGWRDTTRLARGDTAMGAEIFATNADRLAERLRAYRARLDAWLELLEAPGGADPAAIRERLEAARDRLESPARAGADEPEA
ncbi:MAG TPA: prephenate dehydrogenase/arogenate dehydrogenase family protein [Candidatus Limnocylindrales bacterium]